MLSDNDTKLIEEARELIANAEAHRGDLSYQCEIKLAWPQVVERITAIGMAPALPDFNSMPYPALVDRERAIRAVLDGNHRIRAKLTNRRVVEAWDAHVADEQDRAHAELAAIEECLVARGVRSLAPAA